MGLYSIIKHQDTNTSKYSNQHRHTMANFPVLIFGGASITADNGSFTNTAEVSSLFETLKSEGINHLDTAQTYGGGTSEKLIGQGQGLSEFFVDTKHPGGWIPGSSTRKGIFERAIASLERLGVEKVRFTIESRPTASAILTTPGEQLLPPCTRPQGPS